MNMYDVTDFGAVGDGVTDCTDAFNAATAAAGKTGGVVNVPPGTYLSGTIKLYPGTSLIGYPAWSFRKSGGSVIVLNNKNTVCLLDITGAFGCTVKGVCLEGGGLGENIHGIYLNWDEYNGGGQEDTPAIEDCRVNGFTGDGVHLRHIWCFSVRHCMLCNNVGSGLFVDGWDGFIIDNWFSCNRNCGVRGGAVVASLTMTGNRVEWNGVAGFLFKQSDSINITGNFFDRSEGPALKLCGGEGMSAREFTVTGNIFRRSGKPDHVPLKTEYDSSHVYLDRCINITLTGNSFSAGQDDGGGISSPEYAIVYRKLKSCVIMSNVMESSSFKAAFVDLGEHEGENIITANVGGLATNREKPWPSFEK